MSQDDKSDKVEEFRQRFGSQPSVRRDPATIERRRQHVWEMFLEGVPQTVMADILHVTRQTISSDLDYMEKRAQAKTHNIKNNIEAAEADIGLTCDKLLSIAEEAFAQASQTQDPQDKDRYLNTAQRALMNYSKVRVDTGIWPKAGIEVRQKVEHQVSFETRFGKDSKAKIMDNPQARRRILAVAEGILKLGMESAETIDAKVVTGETTPGASDPEKKP
jgi:hypothetical protein